MIVTAVAVHEDHLLLTQLATGPLAGFWLLPSATVEDGTVAEALEPMLRSRTGYTLAEGCLRSVIEEPRTGLLALRFVFDIRVGEKVAAPEDGEIAQVRWMDREGVRFLLEEREIVPTLGVMSLLRSWVDAVPLPPLAVVLEDALCPCGSGFRYGGCCGWDAQGGR